MCMCLMKELFKFDANIYVNIYNCVTNMREHKILFYVFIVLCVIKSLLVIVFTSKTKCYIINKCDISALIIR